MSDTLARRARTEIAELRVKMYGGILLTVCAWLGSPAIGNDLFAAALVFVGIFLALPASHRLRLFPCPRCHGEYKYKGPVRIEPKLFPRRCVRCGFRMFGEGGDEEDSFRPVERSRLRGANVKLKTRDDLLLVSRASIPGAVRSAQQKGCGALVLVAVEDGKRLRTHSRHRVLIPESADRVEVEKAIGGIPSFVDHFRILEEDKGPE